MIDPDAPKVLISDETIALARSTMFPLMEAQAQVVATDDATEGNPTQANMLAHAGLLLHACRELNIDVNQALIAASYMVGIMKTTRETLH